jgi:anti-anti-sigma factor
MNIHIKHSENGAQAKLAGELTIYTVTEIKTALAEVMGSVDDIEVDLSDVTEIDTAGLQLMLIARRHPGKDFRFVNLPPSVRHLIELANVGNALGDSASISAVQTEEVRHEQ